MRCARPVRGKDGVSSSAPTTRAKNKWTGNFHHRESAFRCGSDSVLRWRSLTDPPHSWQCLAAVTGCGMTQSILSVLGETTA
ncbi:hypothetical protein QQF64_021991 [Cirrhinus molitorella]|uniref:Uncharacterized protein n=2 Tax=Cirrhinus molitorella TaxID=172907 RepID=A0ABR3LAW0_9TELE|nr:hypothetical protein Q8A67_024447 [Cirrhinus molitorella]